jgi:prolyl 4-hydroxylase
MYIGHFDFDHPLLWTVPDVLTPGECAALVEGAAGHEWLLATVNRAGGRAVDAQVRDSSTAVLRDPALASELYRRLLPHLPARMAIELAGRGRVGMDVVGMHVPLRIYRYEVGQQFALHHDQSYAGEGGARSLLTAMVYLNEGFAGGETDFPSSGAPSSRAPGRRCCFSTCCSTPASASPRARSWSSAPISYTAPSADPRTRPRRRAAPPGRTAADAGAHDRRARRFADGSPQVHGNSQCLPTDQPRKRTASSGPGP